MSGFASLNPESWILNPIFAPRIRRNADLSKTNWFRVGGPAEYLFKPTDVKDLSDFLRFLPKSVPITVLGVGSNVIVRDGGIDGVVIKLGRGFTQMSAFPHRGKGGASRDEGPSETHMLCPGPHPNPLPEGEGILYAGAGVLDVNVAQFALENRLSGLEFLSGIPGTIGGAIRMNAGAYGSDMSKIVSFVDIVLRSGDVRRLSADECGFAYRKSALPEGAVVTGAVLIADPGDKEAIAQRMAEIQQSREDTQPIRSRTGGSTFANPPGHKAWELVYRAGCRGLTLGGAQVSEKHCNFLINMGHATAADLEGLGEEVRKRVRENSGIELEWEIKRIGKQV